MAQRRMFSLKIVDSDAFLDMPQSSQLLYFHLSMRADDDGFVGNPKKIMRMIGNPDDDMKILLAKRFLLPFESGIVVIKHWRIHNYIQNDRYTSTQYLDEKKQLKIKENGSYTENVSILDTQVRLELGKDTSKTKVLRSVSLKDKKKDMGDWNRKSDEADLPDVDFETGEVIKPKEKPKRHYKEVYTMFKDVLGKETPLNWFKNVHQQTCAENLFTERGVVAIKNALQFYKEHKDEEYCPQITSPSDLDGKWTKLATFKKNHGNQ